MTFLLGLSMACTGGAMYYLMTLGLDPHRQRDRLMRACGWLIAGYAIHWVTVLALLSGGAR